MKAIDLKLYEKFPYFAFLTSNRGFLLSFAVFFTYLQYSYYIVLGNFNCYHEQLL